MDPLGGDRDRALDGRRESLADLVDVSRQWVKEALDLEEQLARAA